VKYLSICSGIEAASVAWHPLGWEPLAFSEIEAFPRAVLAHHYPGVPLHGDFTTLRHEAWIADADVLVGGTPCQAFSVAGLRNSLSDDRGNLSLEFIKLADSIDAAREARGRDPAIIVWENVPGVLSVKDNAFGCFLAALAGDVDPYDPPRGKWTNAGLVIGPQRAVAWRILDAQFFGVAQRRRRVFVCGVSLGHPRAREIATSLFPFGESVSRHPPTRPKTGQGFAHPTAPCLTSSGRGVERTGETRGQDPVVAVPSTGDISHCLNAGGMGRQDYETETLIAHTLKGEGFDAPEDGTGRGTPLVPVISGAVGFYANEGSQGSGNNVEMSPTLKAHPKTSNLAAVAYPLDLRNAGRDPEKRDAVNRQGLGVGKEGDPMHTLSTAFVPGVAYAFQPRIARNGRGDMGDIVNALNAQSGETGKGDAAPCVAYGISNQPTPKFAEELSPSLDAKASGGGRMEAVATAMAVRRLTPVECERLQGFPDNYTAIPWKKKPAADCPDGPRYKALGNSMAVPVMRWIGKRIAGALK
jgi:DNA (cytosine-5)-methyltransferase 1